MDKNGNFETGSDKNVALEAEQYTKKPEARDLGGFGPEHLRSETKVVDFVAGESDIKPKKENILRPVSSERDEFVDEGSPVYVVFRDGISRGVERVLGSPVELENLWNTLAQNPTYYEELLKRKEII